MASSGGTMVLRTIRALRTSLETASRNIRDRLVTAAEAQARTEAQYARLINKTSRLEAIKQAQRGTRNYTTTRPLGHHTSSPSAPRVQHPISRTSVAVGKSTARTPFASTLRPNLTGGALPRTSSGYANGAGRARYFSHAPAPASEVVANVSQAVRAFWQAGQKARFEGYHEHTGGKRFRAVSALQERARGKIDMHGTSAAGSYIDFKVSPTITAVGPLSSVPHDASWSSRNTSFVNASDDCEMNVTNDATLNSLATDFGRALKTLAAVMNDLKNLSKLGSLPLSLVDDHTLRVRFPGCDRDIVERLCLEVGVKRGIVGEDDDFHHHVGSDVDLRFPFAPSADASQLGREERPVKRMRKSGRRDAIDWTNMLSTGTQSVEDPAEYFEFQHVQHDKENHDPMGYMTSEGEIVDKPDISSPEGYSSLHPSEAGQLEHEETFFSPGSHRYELPYRNAQPNDFEGIEGIHRFIAACDRARRSV